MTATINQYKSLQVFLSGKNKFHFQLRMQRRKHTPQKIIPGLSMNNILLVLLGCCLCNLMHAQQITNGDGSPLTTQYCYLDENYTIAGQPGGGTFTGCGVFQQNGQWFFNPVLASSGVTVFPTQCNLVYTQGGGSVTRNILIWKPVIIDPPLKDSFTCSGQFSLAAYTLYAGAYDYQWSPAAPLQRADTSITDGFINTTTTFVITATDNTSNCMGSDTVVIEKYPVPQISTSNDTTILARGEVQLGASGAATYQWLPDKWLSADTIASPVAKPQTPIEYQVIGTNEFGCSDTATITIGITESIFIPSAFSPNGDGINDAFRIENFGYQEVLEFSIFNRWGQRIFQTMDGSRGWDGSYNSIPAETGAYYYMIKLAFRDGATRVYKGDVMLIR